MDQAVNQPEKPISMWRPLQVYVLAAVCLLIGLPIGYLVRGSAPVPPQAATQAAAASMQQLTPSSTKSDMPHAMPSMEEMKHMADKKAEPLLQKLKTDPDNAELLNKIGIIYRSTHQFSEATEYFRKSLQVNPKNADVRTDMAACMYYTGDTNGALAELEKALSYDPKHAGALMNIGIIRWKGKNDVPGAVAAWNKLLKLNPSFPQKDAVQRMISEAQQTGKAKG